MLDNSLIVSRVVRRTNFVNHTIIYIWRVLMPNYNFINEQTNEAFTAFMTIAEKEVYLSENPHIKQTLTAPSIGDPVRLGVKKIDRSFNDLLIRTKEKHLHSTVESHY